MAVLLVTDPAYLDHVAAPGHPESPARLRAVLDGIARADLRDAVVPLAPHPAHVDDLLRVHEPFMIASLQTFIGEGGGRIDADTGASPGSWIAATLAAGAGLTAIEHLDRGEADAAFLAVRPPGHHATPDRAMGFCLLNNVAIAAAALAERGERVLIVDYDVHHGNGTQDAFYADPRVAYVSAHQDGLYPGSGDVWETGTGEGVGTTLNLPFPARTGGRCLPRRYRLSGGAVRRAVLPYVGAAVGRVRRAQGRPAGRPHADGGRLRRPHAPPHRAGPARPPAGVPRGRLRPRCSGCLRPPRASPPWRAWTTSRSPRRPATPGPLWSPRPAGRTASNPGRGPGRGSLAQVGEKPADNCSRCSI